MKRVAGRKGGMEAEGEEIERARRGGKEEEGCKVAYGLVACHKLSSEPDVMKLMLLRVLSFHVDAGDILCGAQGPIGSGSITVPGF